MRPLLPVVSLLALLSAPLNAQVCNLGITVTCEPQGSASRCTAVTTNNGSTTCSGVFDTGFEAVQGTFSNYNSGLTGAQCFDSSIVPGPATAPFVICFGEGTRLMCGFVASVNEGTPRACQLGPEPLTLAPVIRLPR